MSDRVFGSNLSRRIIFRNMIQTVEKKTIFSNILLKYIVLRSKKQTIHLNLVLVYKTIVLYSESWVYYRVTARKGKFTQ